jgi:8-amino-7-oxononanoate synthase
MLERYERALRALGRRERLRALAGRGGIDFTSNDYLGLAESAELKQAALDALERGVPMGAGGSRLLRGNHPEHEALEAEAAALFGAEAALFFGSGFAANEALVATLPQRGDLVLHDALIHASLRQGLAASRADHAAFAHNDAGQAEDLLRGWRARNGEGRCFIAVESLYSMDGDFAPLADLAALAARYEAFLLIDEAHATGVYGPQGRGLAAALEGAENVVTLHTCGKALGVCGALLLMPDALRRFMVNRCRSFVYATAPSPLIAASVRAALAIASEADDRRAQLQARVGRLGARLRGMGLSPSGSPIQPVVLGADRRALALADALRAEGFDIRAVRPPTVPEGTARLRLALGTRLRLDDIDALCDSLAAKLTERAA